MVGGKDGEAIEQATAAATAATVEVLRQEWEQRLKELEEEQKAAKKRNTELAKEQKVAKELARKAAIDTECDKYTGKSVQRVVRKNLETLDFIKDIKNLWKDLGEEALEGDGVLATPHNLEAVNKAIEGMTPLLDDMEEHVRWELECNISAAESPIGWRAVDQLELEKKKKKDGKVLIKPEDLRKAEKDKISFEKDLRSAARGAKTVFGRLGKKRGWGSVEGDAEASTSGLQRGGRSGVRGRGRGRGRGGASKPREGCFRCGKDHMVRDCPVPIPQ